MAEILGPLNLLDKALPTGVDGTRLAEWALEDGVTYGELANQVALALGDANQNLVAKWGWSFNLTEEIFMEYPNGGSVTAMPELTDMDKPQPLMGSTIGHMIDLRYYGQAIGGTKRFFQRVRSAKIRAAITSIVNRAIWRFETRLLTRLFTNTENVIGTAGYDVPFVRGTGGNVDFAPPAFDGEAFTTSHDHFIGQDSGSKTFANTYNELAETLQEHGHTSPFTAVVARADIATHSALTRWVEIVDNVVSVIDRAGVTSGPQFFTTGDRSMGRIGYFQSDYGLVEVFATARVPTGFVSVSKSYGNNDARNPLAVRVHPSRGFGIAVVPETTPDDDFPVKQLDVDFEFGVGVGQDRTNGAVGYLVSGGTYANPTIS